MPGDDTGGAAGTAVIAVMGAGGTTGAGGQAGAPGTIAGTTPGTCQTIAPSGIGVPAGTVVTVSTSDEGDPATNAIDGDVLDEWSGPESTGWITLTFPAPTMIGAVLIHADAKPVTDELFTVSTSTSPVPLGSVSSSIMEMPVGTLLPELPIPPGVYQDLTISVTAGPSWVGVNEIWLLPASTCP